MKITTAKIEKLSPCEDRLDNFKYHYPKFKGSVETFLSLTEITHSDKIWVVCRLMTDKQLFAFAKAVAYSVLEIYENYVPNGTSVRNLLELLNKYEHLKQAKLDVNFSDAKSDAGANQTELFAAAIETSAIYASTTTTLAAAYYPTAFSAHYASSYASTATTLAAFACSAAATQSPVAYAYASAAAYFREEQEEFQLIVISYIIKNVK